MSWYRDPQLFIYSESKTSFHVFRITKEFNSSTIKGGDYEHVGRLSFSEHLSLGNSKESDFDAFKDTFPCSENLRKFKNSQGLVINWDTTKRIGSWSREDLNSSFWSLPGIARKISDTEQALEGRLSKLEAKISSLLDESRERDEKILVRLEALLEKQGSNLRVAEENSELKVKISSLGDEVDNSKVPKKEEMDINVLDLKAENSELKVKVSSLQDEVDNRKVEKVEMNIRVLHLEAEISVLKAEAMKSALEREDMIAGLEKQVSDLTSKLVQCCGSGAGGGSSVDREPWITDQVVPRNWVPFEELHVLEYSQNIPLIVAKATGGLKLGHDKTTNVQANCFYGGRFPIMVVDVAELTPNREEARFDPSIWGSYTHAGITYAARKLFASEMSGDAHKTC